jgi:multiple sugar transport system substrate-binding protein
MKLKRYNYHQTVLRIAATLLLFSPVNAATTIDFWQFWTDAKIRPVITEIVNDFEKQNPDIKVNVTDLTWANGHEKIVIGFASKTGPDVLELGSDWLAQFADAGHLADISDEINSDSAGFHGWGMTTYDSKVYGFPWILGTRVLFLNRDLLNRAGYDSAFVPINFRQLKEAVYKVDSLGKDIYGWGSNTAEKHRLYKKYLPFFWSNSGRIFSEDNRYCLIASDFAVQALTFYKELHDSCGYVADQRGIEDAFLNGQIGIIISGDWLLKRIELEKRKINFATGLFPGTSLPGRSFLGGEILCVNNASAKKEAAVKFIKFFTSPANQLKFCKANLSSTPSSKEAGRDEYFSSNPHLLTFNKQVSLSNYPPIHPHWVEIEDIIESAVEESLFGKSELVAEPLRKARHKIESLISQ